MCNALDLDAYIFDFLCEKIDNKINWSTKI